MDKYLGRFLDEDGDVIQVYDIQGVTAYLIYKDYFTEAPVSMVKQMVDKGRWVKEKKRG